MLDVNLLTKVTAFLNAEADMLDHKEYEAWLQLWSDDGLYIIPVEHAPTDYAQNLNIAYDDAEMRQLRVQRLTSGEAVSTVGAKPTVRTMSRIRIVEQNNDVITVRCAYCLFEDNKNGIRQFPVDAEFQLIDKEEGFLIKQKVARVMKSEQHVTTINYLF